MLATFGACCMPAFDSFSLEDLKEVMATFGLKQKSKNQMSLKLQELWILMAKKHGNAAAAAASAPPPPPPKEKKPRKKKADAIDAAQAAAAAPSAVVARPSTPILLAHPIPAAAVAAAPVAAKAESEAKSKKRKVASSSSASVIARNEDYAAHILEEDSPALPAAKELIGGIPASTAFQIRAFLRSQTDLYMRILLFQPLELGDLAFVLQEVGGIQLNPFALRGFLDQEGVVTQAKQDQGNRGAASGDRKPKKGGMHKPRAKRARR